MRRFMLMASLSAVLLACGGSDATEEEVVVADNESTGDEEPAEPVADDEAEPAEDEPEDDGMRCLPVSRCHSFANQSCALVDESDAIQDEAASAGDVRQACPGERGIADSVTECFDYIEISDSCRRRPDLRAPEWPCGRTETARCEVVMM